MIRLFTTLMLILAAVRLTAQYCSSYATTPNDQDIYNVTLGSLNNSSDCTTAAPGPGSILKSYGNYTTLPATEVAAGTVLPFSVTVGDCENAGFWHSKVAIFVDLNQDGDFLDTGEKLYEMPSVIVGAYVATGTVTIPATATTGLTRLRVLCVETYSAITPCMVYGWGETEDYTLNITGGTTGPTACSGVPIAGNTLSTGNNLCLGSSVTYSLQYPNTEYTGISYQWQMSTNGTSYTDIPTATAVTYTVSATSSTYVRCKLTCSASGFFGYSVAKYTTPEIQPPSITCPPAVNAVAAGGICTAALTPIQFGSATATDNCAGIVTVGNNFNAMPFAIGSSTIVWTASDAVGNTATCAQTIIVAASATELCNNIDDDCDGQTDEGATTTFYADADGDMFGSPFVTLQSCTTAPEGYIGNSADCNDNNEEIHPGASETCDELDNDCDNITDEGVKTTFYMDADNDGHGTMSATTEACTVPIGYSTGTDDCDDTNSTVFAGAEEQCDELDNNCDNVVDEGVTILFYLDQDNDGHGRTDVTVDGCEAPSGYVGNNTDCDDNNPITYAFAPEVCDNIDNDCDLVADNDVATPYTYFVDGDFDGYGVLGITQASCHPTPPVGLTDICGDCNDNDGVSYPGAPELTAGTDNNCNGIVDDNCQNVSINNILTVLQSSTKVLVYWPRMVDATLYNIQYRPVGSTTFTTINSINEPYVEINNLSTSLDYELRIRTKCTEGFTPFSATKVFKLKQSEGACAKPVLGTVIALSQQSVKAWWNYSPGAIKYTLRYRPSNSSAWTNKNATLPTTTLINLTPGQTYLYQVRAFCTSTNSWTTYSTVGSFTVPGQEVACGIEGLIAPTSDEMQAEAIATADREVISTNVAAVTVQPNPAYDGRFDIIISGFEEEKVEILISDFYGAVHYRKGERFITNQTLTQQVSLPSLPAGIYLVRVEGKHARVTQKVVIVK